MDTDRNLLFGVLALQAGLVEASQFIEACLLWTTRKHERIADVLLARGWIDPADRQHIEYLLERRLQKHGDDIRGSFAALPDDLKRSLTALGDADIQRSLVDGTGPAIPHAVATVAYHPGAAERYSRRTLHATGGIGCVWLAHDGDLGRDVALKELRPERAVDPTLEARFLQEAQVTGQLEHPGIVPVYELVRGRDGCQPFYTMRFIKGRTLSEAARDHLQKRLAGEVDALEFPGLLNAFVTVCNTVAYAHSRGVIHRDLKGQNVILGDFGEVIVVDWGLAKLVGRPDDESEATSVVQDEAAASSSYTVQGQVVGTPAYMAPEQAAGRVDLIDHRTDIYGLGAILYEILTGMAPFTGESTDEVLRKVREDTPTRPQDVWSAVPAALEAICVQALSKQPADRPAAAADLAHAVQGWQEFERQKAVEALRESEALYRSLVDVLPLILVRKDLQGRFTFANERACQSFGKPLEQILGRTDFDLVSPTELAEASRETDRQVLESGRTFEYPPFVYVDMGVERYFQSIKSPVRDSRGKVSGVQIVIWDVTELKRLEEALRQSESLYHSLVETLPLGVWRKDLEGRFIFGNTRFCDSLGTTTEIVIGQTDLDFFPPELATKYREDDRHVHQTGATFATEEEHVTTEGQKLHVQVIKSPVFDSTGHVVGTQGTFWDVTERVRLERALRESEATYQSLVEALPCAVVRKDLEGRFTFANQRFCEVLKLACDEILGRTDFDIASPELAEKYRRDDRHVIETGEMIEIVEDVMFPGQQFWHVLKGPVRDSSGKVIGVQLIGWDVTARKLAEDDSGRSGGRSTS